MSIPLWLLINYILLFDIFKILKYNINFLEKKEYLLLKYKYLLIHLYIYLNKLTFHEVNLSANICLALNSFLLGLC